MITIDRLSGEMGINYMTLYQKTNIYHGSTTIGIKPSDRVKNVFTENERNFLACFALEYLKRNGGQFIPETTIMNPEFNHWRDNCE